MGQNNHLTKTETGLVKRNPTDLAKFTPQVQEAVVHNARQGLPQKASAALAGIHPRTLSLWLKDGDADADSPYAEFSVRYHAAQGEYKAELLAEIKRIGFEKDQWAALMTILERVYPEEFKRPGEGTNVQVNVGILEQRVHEAALNGAVVYDGG